MLVSVFSRVLPKFGAGLSWSSRSLSSAMLPVFRQLYSPIVPLRAVGLPTRAAALPKQIVRGMANHRHKKYIRLAKGFRGRSKNCYKIARPRVEKARQYAYRDRKVKKRDFRKLWIQRINAGSRMYGMTYNSFTCNLLKSGIKLNRKVLSDLAITEPLSFKSVVDVVKQSTVSV